MELETAGWVALGVLAFMLSHPWITLLVLWVIFMLWSSQHDYAQKQQLEKECQLKRKELAEIEASRVAEREESMRVLREEGRLRVVQRRIAREQKAEEFEARKLAYRNKY